MTPILNLKGKVFGRWTVLGPHSREKRTTYWACRCECGTTRKVIGNLLTRGKSKSCGCFSRDQLIGRLQGKPSPARLPFGRASAKALYNKYRNSAKGKKKEFNLNFEEFLQITSRDCHYCGVSPAQKLDAASGTFGHYTYNGIDRVDFSNGYYPSNCVPCCWTCNRAKGTLSTEDFKAWLKKAFLFMDGK